MKLNRVKQLEAVSAMLDRLNKQAWGLLGDKLGTGPNSDYHRTEQAIDQLAWRHENLRGL